MKTEFEKREEVVKRLKSYREIRNVYPLLGLYDVIAEIEVQNQNELQRIVSSVRKSIDGIYETCTLVCIE
jgi:DNA-binding Lrp family transcriptional regulator